MVIEPVSSLYSYFRQALGAVSARRREAIAEPATTDYLANLLVTFATGENNALLERSIVLTLDEALARGPGEQLVRLQSVGDAALYLASFFPDHLARARLDVGLYVHVGGFAYGRAAEIVRATAGDGGEPTVLSELGEKFPLIVDVLAEVAESSALGAVTKSIVQLFDRWKATGSERALEAMARAGAFPAKGGGHAC
jgi:hypothetical protein